MLDQVIRIDSLIFTWLNSTLSHPLLDQWMPLITNLHHQSWFKVFFPLMIFFSLFYKYKHKSYLQFILMVVCVGFVDWSSTNFFKSTLQRPRPFTNQTLQARQLVEAGHYSFPSNHTANLFALAVLLSSAFLRFRLLFFMSAALIGYSRIYVGVHYPTDVLFGAAWGIFIASIFLIPLKRLT